MAQDKVFIGISTDGATERITRGPQGFVDRVLTDFVVHESSWSKEKASDAGLCILKIAVNDTVRMPPPKQPISQHSGLHHPRNIDMRQTDTTWLVTR